MLKRFACLCFIALFCQSTAHAQIGPNLRVDWHLTGIAERKSDWEGALSAYKSVIADARVLPVTIREWFVGTAYYGIARCEARLGNTVESRRTLSKAYEHHFWNTKLIELDSPLAAVCGKAWIDSLGSLWTEIASKESAEWLPQDPIVYSPDSMRPDEKLPLILALHGGNGNYENFAQYWREFADKLHVIIVVPPGVYRESDVTNSWESDMRVVGDYLESFRMKYLRVPHVDSNQVYLVGFSQGAQASIEQTILHPDLYRGAVALSGFTPATWSDSVLDVARSHHQRIYAIMGEWEEPGFSSELKKAQGICNSKGIPFYVDLQAGMIHEVPLNLTTLFPEAWQWIRTQAEVMKARSQ